MNSAKLKLYVSLEELKDLEAAMWDRVERVEKERRIFGRDEYHERRVRRNVALKNMIVDLVGLHEKKTDQYRHG